MKLRTTSIYHLLLILVFPLMVQAGNSPIIYGTDGSDPCAYNLLTGDCIDSGGGGGGANTSLSNLTATSINENLVASDHASYNFGSNSVRWNNGFFVQGLEIGDSGSESLRLFPSISTPSGTNTSALQSNFNHVSLFTVNSSSSDPSKNVYVETGNNEDTGESGSVNLRSGETLGSGAATGNINLTTGNNPTGTGVTTGQIYLTTGNPSNDASNNSGGIYLQTGTGGAASGPINLLTGDGSFGSASGAIALTTGNFNDSSGGSGSGNIDITTGAVLADGDGKAGDINLITGPNVGTGDAGSIILFTGASADGASGNIQIATEGAAATNSGSIDINTGVISNNSSANAGPISIISGQVQDGSGFDGEVFLATGGIGDAGSSANGSPINIYTGAVAGSGDSGNVLISTGTVTSGDRGSIQLSAAFLLMPQGTTDPTAPEGSVYWNSSTNKLRLYDGSTWVDLN